MLRIDCFMIFFCIRTQYVVAFLDDRAKGLMVALRTVSGYFAYLYMVKNTSWKGKGT